MKKKILSLLTAAALLLPAIVFAQVDSGVKVTQRQDDGQMLDSVKQTKYPYTFPLLGKKAASKGFLLPYPLGIMLNAFNGSQQVSISDLSVGINNSAGTPVIPYTSLDDVVHFGEVKAVINNVNARADVWVLPFLDVYGIFGKAWVQTDVSIDRILDSPVDISTSAKFDGYVYGFGGMLTGGIHSFFASLDYNMVWTHFDQMAKDNSAMNLSLRTGYVIHLKHPESNVALWLGAGRVYLNSITEGTINLADVAPDLGGNYQNTDWYQGLKPRVQDIVDRTVENFVDKNKGDVINYSLTKRPVNNWTMIIGAQYQLNRRWQFRTEVNVLGGRRSGLLSANYRFGIK